MTSALSLIAAAAFSDQQPAGDDGYIIFDDQSFAAGGPSV